MVRLEETIRELKGISRKNLVIAKDGGSAEVNKPYHVMFIFSMIIVNES